jgi:hypothetical protein
LLCGERRGRSPGHNDIDRHRNQFRCQRGVALVVALGKARLEPQIVPFDVAILLQLSEESLHGWQRQCCQHANTHGFRRLLRACR